MTQAEREGAMIANHLMDFIVRGELYSDEAIKYCFDYLLNEAGLTPEMASFVRNAEAFLGQIRSET